MGFTMGHAEKILMYWDVSFYNFDDEFIRAVGCCHDCLQELREAGYNWMFCVDKNKHAYYKITRRG